MSKQFEKRSILNFKSEAINPQLNFPLSYNSTMGNLPPQPGPIGPTGPTGPSTYTSLGCLLYTSDAADE